MQRIRIPWIAILALVLTDYVAGTIIGSRYLEEKSYKITLYDIDDFESLTQVCFIEHNHTDTLSGAGEFKSFLKKSRLWVDKSLLAAEVLKTADEVVLLTTPRKFGKSLNLDMLKTIFENDSDTNDFANAFFKNGTIYENGVVVGKTNQIPLISKNQQFMTKYFRKTPVVYLNLKDLEISSFLEKMQTLVANMYRKHFYLRERWYSILNDEAISPEEKDKANHNLEIYNNYRSQKYSDNARLARSVVVLCQFLYDYHHRKCIVLIDEFDSIQNDKMLRYKGTISADNDPIHFMQCFLSTTFKEPEAGKIEKGILTGITRIAKSTLLSGLNNVLGHNDLNLVNMSTLTPFYGFTPREVQIILKKEQPNTWQSDYETAVAKYDGYNSLCLSKGSIFNPWDIMRFFPHRKADAYWEQTGSNLVIETLLRYDFIENIFYDILKTKKGYEIETSSLHTIRESMLDQIRDLLLTKENPLYYQFAILINTETISESLMAFMVQSGYLTFENDPELENDPQRRAMKNMQKVKLVIPNLAIKQAMHKILTLSLKHKMDDRKSRDYDEVLAECVTYFTKWFKRDFDSQSEYDSADLKTSLEGLRQHFENLFNQSGKFTDLTYLKFTRKPAEELYNYQHLSETAVRKTLSPVFEKFRRDAEYTVMEEWGTKDYGMLDSQFCFGDKMVIVEYKSDREYHIDTILDQSMKYYSPLILSKKQNYKWVKFLAINYFQKDKDEQPTLELAHRGMTWSELQDYVHEHFGKNEKRTSTKM